MPKTDRPYIYYTADFPEFLRQYIYENTTYAQFARESHVCLNALYGIIKEELGRCNQTTYTRICEFLKLDHREFRSTNEKK